MAGNNNFSPDLGYGSSFNWGGRSWTIDDRDRFIRMMGRKKFNRWARKHAGAAKVFSPVDQEVLGMYKPQLDAIARQRKMEQEFYDRQARNLSGFTAALGSLLAGGPGAMSDLFGNGAATMTAAGDAYGKGLNADQAAVADANNQVLDAIDAGSQQSGGDAGSVLAGVAGWIPSVMMGEQGQAWSDRMAHFPTEAALQANLMMKDIMRQAMEADKEWGGRVSDVLSGMPADRAKVKDMLIARQQAKAKARLDQLKFEADQAYREYLRLKGEGQDARAERQLALYERKQRQAELEAKGYDIDGNLLPGFVVGKDGRVHEQGKGGSGNKGPSAADRAYAQKDINGSQEDIQKDIAAAIASKHYFPPTAVGPPGPKAVSRKKLFLELYRKYKPLTRGSLAAQKQLRKIINQLLDAADQGKSGGGGGGLNLAPAP